MELTPIKVRGKRRAKGDPPVAASSKRHKTPKQETQRQPARARLPKASNIEKSMPLEILERIFWYSENVNFPRASPRLGWLLSGPSTLRGTFLRAFAPSWHLGSGSAAGTDSIPTDSEGDIRREGDVDRLHGIPDFQTDLLACSWATIDMILDCWDIWVRRRGRGQTLAYSPTWDRWSRVSNVGSGAATGVDSFKTAREYFYHDYASFRKTEPGNLGWRREFLFPEACRNLLCAAEIPDELITGPWDEGTLQKFFWLVQTGAHMSSRQTWELGLEGFRNALSNPTEPNLTALRLLRLVGALGGWPAHVSRQEYEKPRGNMAREEYDVIEIMLLSLHEEGSRAEDTN